MPQTRGFNIKGNQVIFRELCHCIHSNNVKKKQGSHEIKHPQSAWACNIGCNATIHLWLEWQQLLDSYSLEVELNFKHNHVIKCAESLSFCRIKEKVHEELLNLFKDGYSASFTLHTYENILYLNVTNKQELLKILVDWVSNPRYDYIVTLFQKYKENVLGDHNKESMFKCLEAIVKNYNNSGHKKAILQEYDTRIRKSFILCIITNLMCCMHKKVFQAEELYYIDASASFDPLNTSITLLYTSWMAGTLLLGLFVTSDELEITLKKAIIIYTLKFNNF